MRTPDKEAQNAGFRYKLDPLSHTFSPLYVKTLGEIPNVLRNLYPEEKFQITDLKDLRTLYRLMEQRANIATHECNGDPHPAIPATYPVENRDKSACAAAWGKEDDRVRAELEAMAFRCGFTHVDWPGLYPSFKDAAGYEVIEP